MFMYCMYVIYQNFISLQIKDGLSTLDYSVYQLMPGGGATSLQTCTEIHMYLTDTKQFGIIQLQEVDDTVISYC